MTFGNRIGQFRRKLGMTQETLAQRCGVTNQAVSKWESDACFPDIGLLPCLADVFGVTIDDLFGRESAPRRSREEAAPPRQELPWEDDGELRVVLYVGRELVGGHPARETLEFCYEGPALNVHSECALRCDSVRGSVTAGGSVTCDGVGGSVNASGSVTCDEVNGDVRCGGNVTCDEVNGNVHAGGNVTCDEVFGNVTAGGSVRCDHVEGNITIGKKTGSA